MKSQESLLWQLAKLDSNSDGSPPTNRRTPALNPVIARIHRLYEHADLGARILDWC
jgi:hypothetical protein